MDDALIVVSIISTIGMLAGVQLINHNWFKKEAWKFKRDQTKKVDSIKLKSLEKKLLGEKSGGTDGKTGLPANLDIGGILNIAKNLEPEQLQSVIQGLTGDNEGEGGTLESILSMIPPETIQSFIKGATDKMKEKSENEDDSKIQIFER